MNEQPYPAQSPPRLRMLVVEDNPHDLTAFRRAFSKNHVECEIVHDVRGEEALKRLETDSDFDLGVIDYGLPGISGLSLCLEILKRNAPFPLVLLTGMGSEQLAVEALKAGVQDYLVKDPNLGYLELLPVVLPEVVRRHQDRVTHNRLNEQMQTMQRLESMGVLAGGIAHHFNNLLAIILANAELAIMDLEPDSPVRESILEIQATTQRAAKVSKQMLTYSGKGTLLIKSISLSELVEEMAPLLEIPLSKKTKLIFDLAKPLPHVRANGVQLRQVMMNLLTNAAEAIGDAEGTVTIRTALVNCDRAFFSGVVLHEGQAEGDYVCIEVADTGGGMNAKTRARIFDPFFTTHFTGRGLGLPVVLGIVRGHHGAIRVETVEGRGSKFQVLLPVEKPESETIKSQPA